MKNVILAVTSAAIAAFALSGPAAAKSWKYRHHAPGYAYGYQGQAYGPYARQYGPGYGYYNTAAAGPGWGWGWGGGAMAYGGAQAFPSCFKETNKDWGFGYPGDCATGNTPANIARFRDQRLGGGGN